MKKLVIFGTKDIARQAFFHFSSDREYQVVAFAVDPQYYESDTLLGVPVVRTEQLRELHPPEECAIFVGIAYGSMNQHRASVYERMREWGYRFASYIDPKASVLTQDIGENVLVMGNVTIQGSVRIGNNVIVCPNVAICHDTWIKDHNYLGPGACFCGENVVEEYCVIGASATIAPRVHIGKSNFIGTGAFIFNSTGENETYFTRTTPKSKLPASRAWMVNLLK